jgi:HEAT repeat protein
LPIDFAAATCQADPAAHEALESRLLGVLASNPSLAAKGYVCEMLAAMGTARSVSSLAALLSDAATSHPARRALEAIGDATAAQALREALPQMSDDLKLGVIQSLGTLRDQESVDSLAKSLESSVAKLVRAAADSLGKIGGERAEQAVLDRLRSVTADARSQLVNACLDIAQRHLAAHQGESAARVYQMLEHDPQPQVRWAAFQGLISAQPAQAQQRLIQALSDSAPASEQELRMVGQLIRQTVNAKDVASYAESIGELPIASQVVLLDAIGSVAAPAVRAAALSCLKSDAAALRLTAAKALAKSGQPADVATLSQIAATVVDDLERQTLMQTLQDLPGPEVDAAIVTEIADADPGQRTVLIRTLANRRIRNAGTTLLKLATDEDPQVRLEALRALQTVADPSLVEPLVELLARTTGDEEREAADRAVWRCSLQIADPALRADALLTKLPNAGEAEQAALLPALGRIGGPRALEVVQQAIKSPTPAVREAGVRALTNWPDATVADQLWELVTQDPNAAHQTWALRAFARVLPQLAREQPDQVATRLEAAMNLAERDTDQKLILSRLPAVRSEGALTLALSCLEKPDLRADAIEVTTELAEAMKDSHPQAARKALETIGPLTDNPELATHIQKILWNMQLKGK